MHLLKKIRLEKKLSATQFAKLAGVTASAIYSYEYGSRHPSYECWKKHLEPTLLSLGYHGLIYEDMRMEE